MVQGTQRPWSYFLLRLLFKFVLKIFYGTIVVENAHLIPKDGKPCVVCANHSNSLTDALIVITTVPSKQRSMLRLTAKSTMFGHRTLTSWLVESTGTIPIKRRKDFVDGDVDNTEVMEKLMQALELGDAVALFPEGMSRYHPTVAPLKTGVSRIISDVLSRNRDNPEFEFSLVTCSVTYMHRQHFRSDVLVTFHPPMNFRPKDNPELLAPVDFNEIRCLTTRMHQQISSGTLDSPSWNLVRSAKLAAGMYAPLGTRMALGDYVRVAKTFLEAFKASGGQLKDHENSCEQYESKDKEVAQLCDDLKAYQDQLSRWGIKDDRIRKPLSRRTIVARIIIRLLWSLLLFHISIPGIVLWLPVFATTLWGVHKLKQSGPIFDTWDEIAQYKLLYGLVSGICVWVGTVLITMPFMSITIPILLVPALMWLTLRWLEDAVSAFRALAVLCRLLCVGQSSLKQIGDRRADLHSRVMNLAVQTLGLPDNPEDHFVRVGGRQKGRVNGMWESIVGYFSVRRRRKRDWNETLRLYDKVDYPDEG